MRSITLKSVQVSNFCPLNIKGNWHAFIVFDPLSITLHMRLHPLRLLPKKQIVFFAFSDRQDYFEA